MYFGVIEKNFKIDYVLFKVLLFKYKWIFNNTVIQIDELQFTQVDFGKTIYMIKPAIMTFQTKQLFLCNSTFGQKMVNYFFLEKTHFLMIKS